MKLAGLGRWRRLLILGLGLGAVSFVAPKLPQDRRVTYRLGDASLSALEVSWSESGSSSDSNPLREARWEFPSGAAPSAVSAELRLPDGRYDVLLRLQTQGEVRDLKRSITLGDVTTLSIDAR